MNYKWTVWMIGSEIASCVYCGYSQDQAFDTYETLGHSRKFSTGIFRNNTLISFNGRKDESKN